MCNEHTTLRHNWIFSFTPKANERWQNLVIEFSLSIRICVQLVSIDSLIVEHFFSYQSKNSSALSKCVRCWKMFLLSTQLIISLDLVIPITRTGNTVNWMWCTGGQDDRSSISVTSSRSVDTSSILSSAGHVKSMNLLFISPWRWKTIVQVCCRIFHPADVDGFSGQCTSTPILTCFNELLIGTCSAWWTPQWHALLMMTIS